MTEEILGKTTEDMAYVSGLVTSSDRQRRGYGGAVLDAITNAVSNDLHAAGSPMLNAINMISRPKDKDARRIFTRVISRIPHSTMSTDL